MNNELLLKVKDYRVRFNTHEGTIYAVNNISYELNKGETLGIVGESGSGKTVSCMSMLKLISMPPGKIEKGSKAEFNGVDLVPMKQKELRKIRGKEIGVIFQDPMTAFNQVITIREQMTEGYISHFHVSKKVANARAIELFKLVGIPSPEERLNEYPSEFSGGMRQRAMIAMALMCEPKLLIADEPTTALDVTIQAQIVDLVKDIKAKLGTSIIWISHDLGIIAGLADKVVVMYGGQIVEAAPVEELYANPKHPYTLGLLNSLPSMNDTTRLISIPGMPPYMNKPIKGCPFAPRCTRATAKCQEINPALVEIDKKGHKVACLNI